MRILSKKEGQRGSVLLLASEEGWEEPRQLTVTEEEYVSLGSPAVGTELAPATVPRLLAADEAHRALRTAARILEFSDNNPTRLTRKLLARGFSRTAAERAVAALVEGGYIRESDQLERAVAAAARKLWGPRRIADALTAKGFARKEVHACITRLAEEGEISFEVSRRLLLEKRGADLPPEKKKALLYRYGY